MNDIDEHTHNRRRQEEIAGGHLDFAPAVLDDAHNGDITGALGTLSMHDRGKRRTWKQSIGHLGRHHGPRAHRDDR